MIAANRLESINLEGTNDDPSKDQLAMQEKIAVQLELAEQAISRAWELGDELEKAALWIAHGVVMDVQIRREWQDASERREQRAASSISGGTARLMRSDRLPS